MKRWLIAVVCILVTGVAYYFMRDDDKSAVISRFKTIVEAIEKAEGEGNIRMAAQHQILANSLADTLEVSCESPKVSLSGNADEMLSKYAIGRGYCTSIHLSYSNVEVRITGNQAELTCIGSARIVTKNHGTYEERKPVVVGFVKKDGKWLGAWAKERQVFK